jgi:undecaprenyl diphosphate synthase
MNMDLPIPAALMPRHVAIIMDGNGRWAKAHGMPRAWGHRQGVIALEPIITLCGQWGIEALTLFAFSTENWARPKDEVAQLMGLIVEFFNKKIDELDQKGVCIRLLGDLSGVPQVQRETANLAMARTRNNGGLKLNIALNYGGRQEIVRAARRLAQKCRDGEIAPEGIDEAAFEAELYTAGLPMVDLLIRTSGEERLSNFLLYQCAYAEFVFVKENWPDFSGAVFASALETYARRDRRFGKV